MRRPLPLLLLVAGSLLLLSGAAAGYEEAEAPTVDPLVEQVWHEPEVVGDGMQWEGFLKLRPGHGFDSAYYQICRVGRTCFAPPTLADRVDNDTFAFDTEDYQVAGRPVHYEAGWRLGVKWCVQAGSDEAGACHWIPAQEGRDPEDHYFAFEVAGGDKGSPGLSLPALLTLVLLATVVSRRP